MNKPFVFNSFSNPKSPWTTVFNLLGLIRKEKLLTPIINVIQDIDNNEHITINWNVILHAEKYRIYINNRLIDTVYTNSFDYIFDKNGIYNIYVRAYGSKEYSPSNKSNIVEIKVTNLSIYLAFGLKKILANMKNIFIKDK